MRYVKTFENFGLIYESDEVVDVKKETPEAAGSKEIAKAIEAEKANKSAFSQKFKAEVAAQNQVETKPEEGKNESTINEDLGNEGELLNMENIKKYAKALVPKLPILKTGDKQVKFGYNLVDIPVGAQYEAYNINVLKDQVSINYKDKNGKFKEVAVSYKASEKELQHMKTIFENMGKKLTFWDKVKSLGTKAGLVLGAAGFLAVIGGFLYQGTHHGSGSEALRDIPMLIQAGGAALAAAGASGILTNQVSKKFDIASDVFACFTSLLKAFIEPLGLKIEEIQTIGDIQTIFSSPKVMVEIENSSTSRAIENVSNRLKGFDKF